MQDKPLIDDRWDRIRAHNQAEQQGLTADGWVFPTLEARARYIARTERYWALRGIAHVAR